MTVTLPETLQYGKVVGRFVLAVADVPEDPDSLPNAVPATGTISFTSMNPLTKETTATPPTTVVRSVIPAAIDNNGYLYNPKDPTGPRGIWLVAGPYKVSYALNTGAIAGHDVLVLPEHDDLTPLDLISALPPGGPILTASQYAELTARMDALEAAGGGTTDHSALSNRETADQHPMGSITGLLAALSDKSPTSHDHAGLYATSAQGAKADTAIQPAALSAAVSALEDADALLAADIATRQTAAQVDARVEQVIGTAPANLDTLEEIAIRLSDDADVVAALTTTVASKASNTLEINGYPLTADIILSASDVGAATSAQGALAESAVQPGDLPTTIPLRVVETTAATAITAASSDHAKLIQLTATTAVEIELPAGVTVGTQIEYQAIDTGLATFVLGAGASWRPAPTPSAIMLDTGSAVTAICVDTDTWMLVGRLA